VCAQRLTAIRGKSFSSLNYKTGNPLHSAQRLTAIRGKSSGRPSSSALGSSCAQRLTAIRGKSWRTPGFLLCKARMEPLQACTLILYTNCRLEDRSPNTLSPAKGFLVRYPGFCKQLQVVKNLWNPLPTRLSGLLGARASFTTIDPCFLTDPVAILSSWPTFWSIRGEHPLQAAVADPHKQEVILWF
jgi:hypothetical protein